jgi:O-antigen ligase
LRQPLLFIFFTILALLAGFLTSQHSSGVVFMGVGALAVFTVSFLNSEWALYILIFSMLLSPELGAGTTAGGTLGRGVTLRLDDFLLVVIGFSWFAKNAIHKELGLLLKTPLNRSIFFYIAACALSTCFGILAGRIDPKTGFFFVLKYFEYIIVFFMMVNHVENMEQVKRFVFCLFLTCLIVSLVGTMQIPGGGRVSAPFEGEVGEPNTFGGYLLFLGFVAAGILSKIKNLKYKQLLVCLILVIIPPFLFTQSRASYLAAVIALFVLGYMMERRFIIIGLLLASLFLSPFLLPNAVKERMMYTFKQQAQIGQISVGELRIDTSTSARLNSWKDAFTGWTKQPILGYGVTGFAFIDAQFPRVLVESGVIGLAAFCYMLLSIFKMALSSLQGVKRRYSKGLVIGFIAGFIGLLVHAIGSNTFIIVRIMEPFWFFTGIVYVLPALEEAETSQRETTPA